MGFDFVSFFPRAVMQGIPLLFGSTGEILTEKSGNLNLGIPGIMYVGGISGVIGAFFYEQAAGGQLNGFLAIMIPILCSLLGSLLMGLLYCFLTVTLRANQNVTGLAMTTFGVGVGNFFGGSLIKLTNSEVPSIALANTSLYFKTTLPGADSTGWFGELFLSYGFLAYVAIIIALGASYFLNHTRPGLHLRAVGESASTADAAGINVTKYKLIAFVTSASLAGAAGALFGLNYSNVTAVQFDFNTSILVLVYVVLGGLGNIWGSIVATVVLYVLPEALRQFSDYRMLVYAIVLILVMLATNNPQVRTLISRIIPRRKGAALDE